MIASDLALLEAMETVDEQLEVDVEGVVEEGVVEEGVRRASEAEELRHLHLRLSNKLALLLILLLSCRPCRELRP